MEPERSAKRRRVDTPQDTSPTDSIAVAPKPRPFVFPQRKPPAEQSLPSSSPAPTNGATPKSAHELWAEAKAASLARRGRKLGGVVSSPTKAGVLGNEGGHRSSPAKKTLASPSPAKKTLDPLRNQNVATPNTTPSKSGASLNFFKQFHQPKVEGKSVGQKDGTSKKLANGHSAEEQAIGDATRDEPMSESDEDEDLDGSPVPDGVKRKGWTYEKPKKTFEDEIRELEDVARRQADEDESAGGGAASSHKKRQRVATAKALSYEAVRGEKKQPKDTVRRRLDLSDKKKVEPARELPSKQHEATDPMDVDEQEGADLMEIDDEEIVATPRRPAQREPVRSVPSTKAKARIDVVSMPALQDVAFSDEHLRLIQHIVADKLTWNRPTRLCNLADEHAKVSSLITQTVTAGESNSMLVIGARGSGKTTLLNDILRQQLVDHADEFHVVRLNGFIHTDDKIALREIWRQLGREMDLDEEEGASKNYADTMTRLLALLSHPAEHGTDQPGQVTKSVIFILDEFELFANHPRQTLLYNLFDIAQSRKAPIAVLGLTTRIDVAESLEKRVKSRFSHRYVHLGMAKSFAAFQESCQAAVVIDYGDLSVEEKQTLGLKSEIKEKLSKALTKDEENPVTNWNAVIEALFANDDFTNHLKRLYYTTKSVPEFQTSLLLPLATLPINPSPNSHTLLAHLLKSYQGNPLLAPDSKLTLLPTLSTLQLALLISAARLTAIHALNLVPFPQVYEEYKVLASKAKLQASAAGVLGPGASARVWGKEVARGAWEGLVEVGLVLEEGGGGEGGARVDVGLEEIGACEGVELGGWGRWCKEI